MSEYMITFVTAPKREEAGKIAEELIGAGLAACVNIIPSIISFYRWKNEVCRDEECLLVVKSRWELFDRMKEKIVEVHSYEVPEIVSFSIEKGLPDYLDWITETTVS